MATPIRMNFDAIPGVANFDSVVHLPKIYQGAPYVQQIAIKSVDDTYTRDFSTYDDIRMQARWTQQGDVIFEISKEAGTLVGDENGIVFNFLASTTDSITVPVSNPLIINEARFLFDIELHKDGVVTELFAQGSGFIVANITR